MVKQTWTQKILLIPDAFKADSIAAQLRDLSDQFPTHGQESDKSKFTGVNVERGENGDVTLVEETKCILQFQVLNDIKLYGLNPHSSLVDPEKFWMNSKKMYIHVPSRKRTIKRACSEQ